MGISVIIPVYNSAASIERCLSSVLAQTYKADYQIIIVNDGSTDNSLEIINRYIQEHPSIDILVINKPNGGVSSARNAGLYAATGEWIALLDSDDEWLPDKIAVQIGIVNTHPEIDLLGTNVVGSQTRILWKLKDKLSPVKVWELFIKWHPSTPTVIFRSEILKDVGVYDESMRYGEDGEFLLRICTQKNAWFTPEQLVFCGNGKPTFGSSGLSGNMRGMQRGQRQILKRAYNKHIIHLTQYMLFALYAELKYWRRILIVKIRSYKNQ